MKRAFTLVEVLISTLIVWLLFLLLFRTFGTLTDISVRVEGERQMQNELLYLTQTLQTLADNYRIDYERYKEESDQPDGFLFEQQWLVETLYLTNDDGQRLAITTSGDCYTDTPETPAHTNHMRETDCIMIMDNGEQVTRLTDANLIDMSNVVFKLVPADSNQRLLYSWTIQNPYERIQYPWFWLMGRMYHKVYGNDRTTNTKQVIHQYFSVYDQLQL
jgi:type II secretory pathway pseudopilin PulG